MTEWLDSVGDRLEATGTKPGRIFEFYISLGPDLHSGGIVETSEDLGEGIKPRHPQDIKKVVVRSVNNEEIELPGLRALVVANFYRLLNDLT